MTLTAPIPAAIKKRLTAAKLWQTPCLQCGTPPPTEAHHAVTFAGKRVQHPLAIIPLCQHCHRGNNGALTDPDFCRWAIALILSVYWKHCDDEWSAKYYEMRDDFDRPQAQRGRIVAWADALMATAEPPTPIAPIGYKTADAALRK